MILNSSFIKFNTQIELIASVDCRVVGWIPHANSWELLGAPGGSGGFRGSREHRDLPGTPGSPGGAPGSSGKSREFRKPRATGALSKRLMAILTTIYNTSCISYQSWLLFTTLRASRTNLDCYLQHLGDLIPILTAIYKTSCV